jgi:hypothetical protein
MIQYAEFWFKKIKINLTFRIVAGKPATLNEEAVPDSYNIISIEWKGRDITELIIGLNLIDDLINELIANLK